MLTHTFAGFVYFKTTSKRANWIKAHTRIHSLQLSGRIQWVFFIIVHASAYVCLRCTQINCALHFTSICQLQINTAITHKRWMRRSCLEVSTSHSHFINFYYALPPVWHCTITNFQFSSSLSEHTLQASSDSAPGCQLSRPTLVGGIHISRWGERASKIFTVLP